jgi:peptidoglycan/xylan/chitin deacetylase (PgdA/CDA1 family)
MRGWRTIRAACRATIHAGLAVGPLLGIALSSSWQARLGYATLFVMGFSLLVWAAFVYIPGFDPLFRIPWRGPRRGHRMAITFDDGPHGRVTGQVLDLFKRHGGKATFFLVGQSVEAEPEVVARIVEEGHAVGSHTYSHAKLHLLARPRMQDEVDRGHECLNALGISSNLFRAPHGLKTFSMVRHLARRGLRLVAWTDGVYDTDCPSAEIIFRRALPKLRAGEILLLHDGKRGHERSPLLQALPRILNACKERKLELVTVPELLGWQRAQPGEPTRRRAASAPA